MLIARRNTKALTAGRRQLTSRLLTTVDDVR
jgi:hypothetical protein